jgi:hypothetical protein
LKLAQLFEREDREASAPAAFKQPLTGIGEEDSEEIDEAAGDAKAIVDAAQNLRRLERTNALPGNAAPDDVPPPDDVPQKQR